MLRSNLTHKRRTLKQQMTFNINRLINRIMSSFIQHARTRKYQITSIRFRSINTINLRTRHLINSQTTRIMRRIIRLIQFTRNTTTTRKGLTIHLKLKNAHNGQYNNIFTIHSTIKNIQIRLHNKFLTTRPIHISIRFTNRRFRRILTKRNLTNRMLTSITLTRLCTAVFNNIRRVSLLRSPTIRHVTRAFHGRQCTRVLVPPAKDSVSFFRRQFGTCPQFGADSVLTYSQISANSTRLHFGPLNSTILIIKQTSLINSKRRLKIHINRNRTPTKFTRRISVSRIITRNNYPFGQRIRSLTRRIRHILLINLQIRRRPRRTFTSKSIRIQQGRHARLIPLFELKRSNSLVHRTFKRIIRIHMLRNLDFPVRTRVRINMTRIIRRGTRLRTKRTVRRRRASFTNAP